jgi:LysM repeat protein
MQHPKRYGFAYKKTDLYVPIATKNIPVATPIINWSTFAKQQGINYKILKLLNPWMKAQKLTNEANKQYLVALPLHKNQSLFMEEIDTASVVIPESRLLRIDSALVHRNLENNNHSSKDKEIIHTVKAGDNLLSVAKKYKVKTTQIIVWNSLEDITIKKGQKLSIYR